MQFKLWEIAKRAKSSEPQFIMFVFSNRSSRVLWTLGQNRFLCVIAQLYDLPRTSVAWTSLHNIIWRIACLVRCDDTSIRALASINTNAIQEHLIGIYRNRHQIHLPLEVAYQRRSVSDNGQKHTTTCHCLLSSGQRPRPELGHACGFDSEPIDKYYETLYFAFAYLHCPVQEGSTLFFSEFDYELVNIFEHLERVQVSSLLQQFEQSKSNSSANSFRSRFISC